MSYLHLITSERVRLAMYLMLLFSIRKIAQHLELQPSIILRELNRNPCTIRLAVNAEHRTTL